MVLSGYGGSREGDGGAGVLWGGHWYFHYLLSPKLNVIRFESTKNIGTAQPDRLGLYFIFMV